MVSKLKYLIAALFLLVYMPILEAAKFYRFTDDNGKLVVSSTLPPEVSQKGYEIVNELGIVLEVVEPRKTDEQLQQERLEEARLREEARKQREQEQLDAILINSYSDISDIERARDNELSSKDRDITTLRGIISRLTRNLEDAQTRAARDERLGKALSPKLMKEIDDFKNRISREQAEVESVRQVKADIENRYNSSIIRFSELKAAERLKQLRAEQEDEGVDRAIYECVGLEPCDQAWAASLRYASEYSTTELAWANDTTIMMRKPQKNDDISIIVTRVNRSQGNNASIVLEVRCNKTDVGESFCDSAQVKSIRENFTDYLR